jgi:muconolactone delta-isomerase
MVKKRKREYTWYLEPSGNVAHSNEVISKNVNREDALQDALCADGKKRNLWRCSSALAYMLWRSRVGLKISFKIFGQEGNGAIRNKTHLFKTRPWVTKKKKKN